MPVPLPYARTGAGSPRWSRLSDYFFRLYGQRVHKIPLDAGFSCPNRDGAISSGGCIFCNPLGSGTGLGLGGMSLAEQWQARCAPLLAKNVRLFIAYLQSYSNTYGPLEKLAEVLKQLSGLPNLLGLAVGTRPDCVDEAKLDLVAQVCAAQGIREGWMEFGVQSSNNATLRRIRRGHDRAAAEWAIAAAERAGLKVCVHLIAGLPGEGKAEFLQSVRWAAAQKIHGIKLHCLYVCRDTALAELYTRGDYRPLTQAEYVDLVAEALPLLRPEIVIQRVTGDPGREELLAPAWASRSRDTANQILAEMQRRDLWQGGGLAE